MSAWFRVGLPFQGAAGQIDWVANDRGNTAGTKDRRVERDTVVHWEGGELSCGKEENCPVGNERVVLWEGVESSCGKEEICRVRIRRIIPREGGELSCGKENYPM